jgi:hypothetical protein
MVRFLFYISGWCMNASDTVRTDFAINDKYFIWTFGFMCLVQLPEAIGVGK